MDYIPRRNADLRDWAANFAALISADPGAYGLSAPEAAAVQSAADAYTSAYTAAADPSTRTGSTVAARREARAALLSVVRRAAGIIRASASVTAAQRAALGLTVPAGGPTPVPAPATFPLIGVVGATPGRHELRFADSATPDRKAKPPGAIGLQLFCAVGHGAGATPDGARLVGQFTANPIRVDHRAADAGKPAAYFARWVTRRGLTGPWSAGVSFTIAA